VHATASELGADGTTGFQSGEEHDLRSFKKMLLGAVATMAVVAGVAVSPASAVVPPPVVSSGSVPSEGYATQDANVPYLAWRGEHVRLEFCDENALTTEDGVATWSLEDWSGDPMNGSVPVPQQIFGAAHIYSGCAYTDYVSQKSGIAFVKLVISDPTDGSNLYEKQFLVGWMDLLKPTVTGGGDVNAQDFCYAQLRDASVISLYGPYAVCDPKLDPRHRVNVLVKGNIPLLANFSEWGLGDHLTMPDDWAKWAAVMARSTADFNVAGAMTNWDIHDDSLLTEGHLKTGGTQCVLADETNTNLSDAVDNCTGGGPWGGFSTVLGKQSRTDNTIGPFDPIYPYDTLLSDGKVDAGDAPMPAARIDVSIRDNNSADPTDISGVGYLYPSYKTEVYSRDGLGSTWQPWNNGDVTQPVKAHNFYAPYYSQYIPATSRPVDSGGTPYGAPYPSGIDGSSDADGFNGFRWSGAYDNWEFAWINTSHPNADSKCLFSQVLPGLYKDFRPLPYGPNSVTVYTDESGEANVNFVPGLGMYFDNLHSVNKNLNGGCDLEGIDPIGTATIDAVAKYPYQPVTAPDQAGDPVAFTVHNLFQKTLTVYSKGIDANGITSNSVAKIVLAHAQDIDGSPLAYEAICWMANKNAEGMRVFVGDIPAPTADDPDAVITLDPWHGLLTTFKDPVGINRLCTFTDENGNSAIEVFNSDRTSVNVIAEFVNEGILRDTFANFATGSVGSTTSADGGPVTHVPSPTQLSQAVVVGSSGPVVLKSKVTPIQTIKSAKKKLATKVLHKIRFAKVVTPFHGKAKLQVRVNGKAGMVKLRIVVKQGKKSHTFVRFVPANKKVAVKNLVIPAKTAKVTVSLLTV